MNAIARSVTGLLVAAAASQFVAANATAGQCCSRCGDEGRVYKVCRPVRTTRLVEITCWDVASEEICLPGRSTSRCQEGDSRGSECRHGGGIACPDCKTRTRQQLMRKTFLKEVPVVVWVVEYVCGPCAHGAAPGENPPATLEITDDVTPTADAAPVPPAAPTVARTVAPTVGDRSLEALGGAPRSNGAPNHAKKRLWP